MSTRADLEYNQRVNTERTDVPIVRIVEMLTDRVPVAQIARELGIERTKLHRLIAKERLHDRVGREIERRLSVAASHRATAADRVLAKAEAAACGEWDPTPAQLELIKYFIGWDAPQVSPDVTSGEHGPLVVQVFQSPDQVIEAAR